MQRFARDAAQTVGIEILDEGAGKGSRFCEHARKVQHFLRVAADNVPAWKVWIRPGLRLAGRLLEELLDHHCGEETTAAD